LKALVESQFVKAIGANRVVWYSCINPLASSVMLRSSNCHVKYPLVVACASVKHNVDDESGDMMEDDEEYVSV